jgi:hypothetical protein
MLISGIPYKFTYVWGVNASAPQYLTTPIPATSTSPAASQQLGFPPATANPSGTPPNINDFNGIFNYLSLWSQWQQAGSPVVYDSTFSANVGGYPQNALLASSLYAGVLWISTIDNNLTDPDTGGANWTQYPARGEAIFTASGSWTCPNGVTSVLAQLWGGGGGGGGVLGIAESSGGSGGGYTRKRLAVVPGTVYTVTVGAGGAGGTGAPTNGSAGGTTSFLTLSATGGGPGYASTSGGQSTTSAGGVGSGGDLNLSGTSGSGSITNGGGAGGASPFGIAGAPVGSIGGTGSAGFTPGGGGGGTAYNGVGGEAGGAGGGGLVILEW